MNKTTAADLRMVFRAHGSFGPGTAVADAAARLGAQGYRVIFNLSGPARVYGPNGNQIHVFI